MGSLPKSALCTWGKENHALLALMGHRPPFRGLGSCWLIAFAVGGRAGAPAVKASYSPLKSPAHLCSSPSGERV